MGDKAGKEGEVLQAELVRGHFENLNKKLTEECSRVWFFASTFESGGSCTPPVVSMGWKGDKKVPLFTHTHMLHLHWK